MDTDVTRFEDRLALLEEEVASLRQRVSLLEGERLEAPREPDEGPPPSAAEEEESEAAPDSGPQLSLEGVPGMAGRTCLVLGGAFLLRAVTEGGAVHDAVGVGLGILYATIWLLLADRAVRAGRRLDGTFHGLATTIIAFPLIWEASTRFEVLPPLPSALALLAYTAVIFGISWHRRLRVLAWIALIASLATGMFLLFQTRSVAPFAVAVFAISAMAIATSYHRAWGGLRWTVAIMLDLMVCSFMIFLGTRLFQWLTPSHVAGLQVALIGLFVATFGIRMLVMRHRAGGFEIFQILAVLAIGFEGALRVLAAGGYRLEVFGVGALVITAACYAAVFVPRRREHAINVAYYTSLGTLLAIEGLRLIAPAPIAGVIWGLLLLVGALIGRSPNRGATRVNVAFLALAAAAGSGMVHHIGVGFTAGVRGDFSPFPISAYVVLALLVAAYVLLRREAGPNRALKSYTMPAFVVIGLGLFGVGAAIVCGLAPLVAHVPGRTADAGALAALRTAVLTAGVWVLARLGRDRRRPELIWAMGLALAIAVLKLPLEDLPSGRPVTLFASFVLLGATLIAAPRLLKRPPAEEDAAPEKSQ